MMLDAMLLMLLVASGCTERPLEPILGFGTGMPHTATNKIQLVFLKRIMQTGARAAAASQLIQAATSTKEMYHAAQLVGYARGRFVAVNRQALCGPCTFVCDSMVNLGQVTGLSINLIGRVFKAAIGAVLVTTRQVYVRSIVHSQRATMHVVLCSGSSHSACSWCKTPSVAKSLLPNLMPTLLLTLLPTCCLPLQVVYILDQVRALEQELRRRLQDQGLPEVVPKVIVVTRLIPEARGNTCNQRIERIHGTEFAYILRIPFRTPDGKVRGGR
jgi:hypothetical protein